MQEGLKKESLAPNLTAIRNLAADDMAAVNLLIHHRLESDVALIGQLSNYIINSGGKRLRPLMVLLAAKACGYEGRQHINLAAVIEFIHTATLLHDDVVDSSAMRRGNKTANAIWGNEATVLVGDFLYSRAFEMMVDAGNMKVMEIMAGTTNAIAEGEVMQLLHCHDPDTTEKRYMEVIYRKTAKLFEAGARLGANLVAGSAELDAAMGDYGRHLGNAFQLIDDVLDYQADSSEIGKNIGDDLAEGKPTLPLIHAMRAGRPEDVNLIRNAIVSGGRDSIDQVIKAVETTGAIAYTARSARAECDRALAALEPLKPSVYRDALVGLAEFAVNRTH